MKKFITFVIFIIIITFIIKGWWNSQLAPVSSDKSTVVFVIDKGEGFSKVSDDLKKANLIKNSLVFSLYGKQSGLESKIQAGTFKISPSESSQDILKTITGNPTDNWVTLIEGWRVEEIVERLNQTLGTDKKEFLKVSKEGYMFPDTYLFPKEYSATQIAKVMRDNFDKKYSEDLKAKIKKLGLTSDQGVILASIVEREARSDSARQMVASILLKRFKLGMGLNADATIQYALGFQKDENPPAGGWWKRHLTHEDLAVKSLFNTYIHSGLPPTPICNPSFSSLTAVANADSSVSYLYYYHDSNGVSHYAKTLEEHNQNVSNYP